MKIGIFGNTNNYPMLLALGLRSLGHDVVLVVNRRETLHRPESKYPELSGRYPDWIFDCSDIPEDEFVAPSPRISEVINVLSAGADGLLLNHIGPSLLPYCGGVPAVAIMTGSDLTYYADPATIDVIQREWAQSYRTSPGGRFVLDRWRHFISRQRAGILASRAVSAPFPGLVPALDRILDDMGVPVARRDFLYVADTLDAAHGRSRPKRNDRPLRIVNGARLNWRKPLPSGYCSQDHKGTDVLLQGFAAFLRRGHAAELVLFRKGLDVTATEDLVHSLGIGSSVVWRDELPQREFSEEIAQADVVCDQVGESFPGLVALDAMARGIPVVANFQPGVMSAFYERAFPGCQASTAVEVSERLDELASSPEHRNRIGNDARQFVQARLSPAVNAARCVQLLQAA